MSSGVVKGEDDIARCWWGASSEDYRIYHDQEWGYPVSDDRRLFEKICLEGFQSGLSWLTILRKRENFRLAFRNFEFQDVATFRARDVRRLLQDAGIVRHQKKIESTINNAKRACEMVEEFGSLAAYFWQYEPPRKERPRRMTKAALSKMPTSPTSTRLSKDLKARGWSFIGPTTAYAFMQAMGLVNDHLETCSARQVVSDRRREFVPPRKPEE